MLVPDAGGHDAARSIEQAETVAQSFRRRSRSGGVNGFTFEVVDTQCFAPHGHILSLGGAIIAALQ
jgi:hypothetical protein